MRPKRLWLLGSLFAAVATLAPPSPSKTQRRDLHSYLATGADIAPDLRRGPGSYTETVAAHDVPMAFVAAKVTRNGHVSLPAELRHRWGTERVLVVDRGDYAIARPVPPNPVGSLRGAYAGPGPTTDEARRAERDVE
ncbi:MAG: AbrB/MazE/SpoVT family DNA-binding domain-containing protein [Dermatophilaceae bacterium]